MAYDEIKWGVDQVNKKLTKLGYPPKAMRGYNVQDAPGAMVKIYFTPPPNTYLKDQENVPVPLVTVDGVEIRKKKGSPIESRSDGEFFRKFGQSEMNNYITTPLIDEDVEIGEKYYYRFFPYSTYGTYNDYDNSQHGVTVTEEGHMLIFGFDQDFRDQNPETQITYPEDCENFGYEPMNIKESLGDVTAGGWEHFLVNVLHNAPYMVKMNGEIDYELDHENFKFKINGEPSDWGSGSYQGMPMAWLSTMYKKEWYTERGEVRHVRYCEGIPVGESASEWIPAGYTPDINTTNNTKKGMFIPITSQSSFFADQPSIDNFKTYNRMSYSPINYTDVNWDSNFARKYLSSIMIANKFCSNYTNNAMAFSTIFSELQIRVINDYLTMLFSTTDLRKVLQSTGTSYSYSDDYSIVPGFSSLSGHCSRVFYSYLLSAQAESRRMVNPFFLDSDYFNVSFTSIHDFFYRANLSSNAAGNNNNSWRGVNITAEMTRNVTRLYMDPNNSKFINSYDQTLNMYNASRPLTGFHTSDTFYFNSDKNNSGLLYNNATSFVETNSTLSIQSTGNVYSSNRTSTSAYIGNIFDKSAMTFPRLRISGGAYTYTNISLYAYTKLSSGTFTSPEDTNNTIASTYYYNASTGATSGYYIKPDRYRKTNNSYSYPYVRNYMASNSNANGTGLCESSALMQAPVTNTNAYMQINHLVNFNINKQQSSLSDGATLSSYHAVRLHGLGYINMYASADSTYSVLPFTFVPVSHTEISKYYIDDKATNALTVNNFASNAKFFSDARSLPTALYGIVVYPANDYVPYAEA